MDAHHPADLGAEAAAGAEAVPAEKHRHGRLFLIDGNNIAYRAFFALPETIVTSTGFPTNALYGFCAMMIKVLSEFDPEAVIVAWDSREKTFRHEEFVEYKAQRKPMPDLLREQWPHFVELSEAFGFVNLSLPGWEADDILATLARQGDAEGREVVIVTGDRDALQLVTERVSVMSNTRGVTEVKVYDPRAVEERFGVPPRLIPDLIGLKGDTSDNIPGVPGIGEKTAALLLAEFGSLEEVLARTAEVKGPKRRELLETHAEDARLSKNLARLDRDAPIDIHTAEVAAHRLDRAALAEVFRRFEFHSLLERLPPPALAAPTDGPAGAEDVSAPTLLVRELEPKDLERALDWERPVGVRATLQDGASRVWFAQYPGVAADGNVGADAPVVLSLPDPHGAAGPLRELLGRGAPVCHDLKGDALLPSLMRRAGHDTMLAAYLLAPGSRSYDFDDLLSAAGLPSLPEGPSRGAAEAVAVLSLAATQETALRALGMWRLFAEVELPLSRVLLDMESAGIHLDCYRLGEITAKVEDQLDGLEAEIHDLAGEEFNLGSPQQLGVILFEKLGLPRQRKTKTGYSTDARTLEALRGLHPIIERFETHRELSKLLSTYLLALPAAVDPATGRLHTTFHQTVTATGRLSSSDPNLQNIPVRTDLGARVRGCFTAEDGNVLVVADYSQIELRIMAHLSGEPALLEAFERGEDIHTHTAAEVFDMPEAAVDSTRRRYAKAVNFGIMYGISSFGLAQQLGIGREEAADYIERYFQRMPRVRAFIDATVADARSQGFVATVMGRRRPIPELRSDNHQTRLLGERLAVNSVIQGSAADIIKVAMLRCHERMLQEAPATRFVLQVHDELIFECPAESSVALRDLVVREMVAAYDIDPPLVVDVGVGEDWLAAK
ncbi:MAG: DNA polymerase I [Thermoleophilia bacterium]